MAMTEFSMGGKKGKRWDSRSGIFGSSPPSSSHIMKKKGLGMYIWVTDAVCRLDSCQEQGWTDCFFHTDET